VREVRNESGFRGLIYQWWRNWNGGLSSGEGSSIMVVLRVLRTVWQDL